MTIAPKKISLLHVAKSRLGLSDENWRDVLRNVAGVGSSRELDDAGFDAVMLHFERMGFKSDFGQRNMGNRVGKASPAQVEKIRALWSEYTAGAGNDAQLGRWLSRQFKISALRFLDSGQAHKAIGALSVMIAKRRGDDDPQTAA
jgi:phage gp16-like protein